MSNMSNAAYSTLPDFEAKCANAKVKPTTRQASKYRNGRGAVALLYGAKRKVISDALTDYRGPRRVEQERTQPLGNWLGRRRR